MKTPYGEVLTPERLSVMVAVAVTVAGAEPTSTEAGLTLTAVSTGPVVSGVLVTSNVAANVCRKAVDRYVLFPALSSIHPNCGDYVPDSTNCGIVAVPSNWLP